MTTATGVGERFERLRRAVGAAARCRRAAAAVEFAVMLPIFVAVVTGVTDYGMATYRKMELMGAARSASHLAYLGTTDTTAIQNAAVGAAENTISSSDVTVTQYCGCLDGSVLGACGDGCDDSSEERTFVTVSISEEYQLLLVPTTVTITGSATIRTQ